MKKLFAFLLLTVCGTLSAQNIAEPDLRESRFRELDSLLTNLYFIYQPESNDAKFSELDKLIEMCGDSLTRQYMTLQIFDHYSQSKVMGEEEVAIKVYDKWILPGTVKTRSAFESVEKQIFVDFNRNSLVGMRAPEIRLSKPNGGSIFVPERGKIAILFFYATDCMKCKLEWEFMPEVLERINLPVNFYAVNCSNDRELWDSFINNFKVRNRKISVKHLWDPTMDSEYQKLYGVTGTPKIFVVLDDGEIIGRRLELENLYEIFIFIDKLYER